MAPQHQHKEHNEPNKPMKILHVIDSSGLYGAEIMLLTLMEEQRRLGLEPILASIGEHGIPEKPLEAEARRRGLSVETFRMRSGPNVAGAFHMLRFARRVGIDILHTHGYKGNILFGFMPRKVRRIPLISTVHGWTWTGGVSRMMIYEWLDRVSFRFIDRVVLVNRAMLDHPQLKSRVGLRIKVVENGISVSSIEGSPAAAMYLNPDVVKFCAGGCAIGAIGRLSPEKGFELLLEAVAGLVAEGESPRLVLFGEGVLRSRLEERVRELGLEGRILMPGYVENARDYLPLFRAFAMPSLTEGMPMVVLEAMCAGVPIIASRVGGIPEVLENGKAGFLINPGSANSVRDGIIEAIGNPEASRHRVRRARQRVLEQYSSQIMAGKYQKIYQSVLPCTLHCHEMQQPSKIL